MSQDLFFTHPKTVAPGCGQRPRQLVSAVDRFNTHRGAEVIDMELYPSQRTVPQTAQHKDAGSQIGVGMRLHVLD
jgi:hypothetical protein